jgi:hypothetical protein
MEEKIKQLEDIVDNLEVMVTVLQGKFHKEQLFGNGTIAEQIDCYDLEGKNFTNVFNSIIKEHGDEPCPFRESETFSVFLKESNS